MSQEEKVNKKVSGIDQFKSRIEELNLSQENELRVKSLFQNYSEKISYSGPVLSIDQVEFKQFSFFPGNVFVIDSELNVVYQNRLFNNSEIISVKSFGGFFNDEAKSLMHSSIESVNGPKASDAFYLNDIKGNYYECNVALYDSVRNLKLVFLYQNNQLTQIEKAGKEVKEHVLLQEGSDKPIKFFLLEQNKFLPIQRSELFVETLKTNIEDRYTEPVSELTSSLQNKMKEALDRGVVKIVSTSNGNVKEKQILIPLSSKHICLVSETTRNERQGKFVDEIIERYKIIANSFTDLFFILDNDLKFTFVAPSIQAALEYQFQELIGEGFDSLVPKWSGNTLQKNLNTVVLSSEGNNGLQKFTIQLSGKYGNLKWYEVQITSMYNNEGKLQGYNGICRDITERLKYEEALMQAKQKAEESDKLKSAFLANMSHEIRTPLNGIIGFSNMIKNQNLSDEQKAKYSKFITSSSKQLLALINDIIDISKIEAGQFSIKKTKIDLHKMLHELFANIDVERKQLNKDNVKLILDIPDEKTSFLFNDEVRLKQIFINLLSNALKFTTEGEVKFGYKRNDRFITFYVKDTGVGIPKEIQRVVFERFRQGNIDDRAEVAGTGLGLAISRGIVDLLGGKISLNSVIGEGSEFTFVLPITE